MATATTTHVLNSLRKMDTRLQRIETKVSEIKGEIGLEPKPAYLQKLASIEKEKGKIFNTPKTVS